MAAALIALSTHATFAQAAATAPTSVPNDTYVAPEVIYGLIALAVVQVIFIIALNSIMRTLGVPGSWVQKLAGRGTRAGVLVPLLLLAGAANAQAYQGDHSTLPTYHMLWWMIGTNLFLFAIMLVQINLLRGLTRAVVGADEVSREALAQRGPTWEQKLLARLTRQRPITQEGDILMHHDYDGIRELDNVLPPWWLWLFYGTVIWSVVYLVNVHVINVWPHQGEEYVAEMAKAAAEKEAYLAKQSDQVDERTVTLLTDASALGQGAVIYKENCATCHGQLGEGVAGPNLTDAYWIHGGDIKSVFNTVKYGVNGKAMKDWKNDLRPQQIQIVSSYILSLQGTNPPNAKPAEGQLWRPDGAAADTSAVKADTAAVVADTTKLAVAR